MRIAVLTGAGISAESGLSTFRDAGGLWEGHDIYKVASLDGYKRNPKLVLEFYNMRRKQLKEVTPNAAHYSLAALESKHHIKIITQNVDDLHERAGSKSVIHLHGELFKVRRSLNPGLIYDWFDDLSQENKCELGSPLRPHIVWFGEEVPLIPLAAEIVANCELLLVIGTSLLVYPAASLIHYTDCPIIYIDQNPASISGIPESKLKVYASKATTGLANCIEDLRL